MKPTSPTELELWFDFASVYSYLTVMRIEERAHSCRVQVRWKPFLLGPIFRTFGWATSPFLLQPQKGAYMWCDIERQCRKYSIPWRRPSQFPRRALLPTRIAMLAAGEPWVGQFCRAIMQIGFAEDREVDTPEAVEEALQALPPDAPALLRAAQLEGTKLLLRQQTEEARRRGIFGAPTFFVGKEMFWGNDRLDEALELAAGSGSERA